jgi:3-phosphoshikimate 1-carboxyvinyltransferase
MLAALADGVTRISGWLPAQDCLATLGILKRLGVETNQLDESGTEIEVTGRGLGGLSVPVSGEPLDCGNSGTTMRLMLGILAGHGFRVTLAGDESLSRRPMLRVTEPLRMMGASITGPDEGAHAPLVVEGGSLKGLTFDLPMASAQVKSALLLAGLHATGATRVREPAPSRDHTERAIRRLGAGYMVEPDGWHKIEGGSHLSSGPWRVPGDISAAAFFMVAAAIGIKSEVEITGVGLNPTRTGLLDILLKMGAKIVVANAREEDGEPVADVVVKGGHGLKGVRVVGGMIPRLIDEIPVLAVAACFAEGVTIIRDAAELRTKESDRIATTAAELGKMGAKIGVLSDGLVIEGGQALKGAAVESHGDHRLAMALAVAAGAASGETTVDSVDCVSTSYPGFRADLARLTEGG